MVERFADISVVAHTAFTGRTVLLRLVEALGFRYRQAVAGLVVDADAPAPIPGAMTLSALQQHIAHLVRVTLERLGGQPGDDDAVLPQLARLHDHIASMPENPAVEPEQFYLINGPLADALTHVGQIKLLRRALGQPQGKVGYYKGEKQDVKE